MLNVSINIPKLKGAIERKSRISNEDDFVRKKMVFYFLPSGTYLKKMDDVKECVECISNQKLGNSGDMFVHYI